MSFGSMVLPFLALSTMWFAVVPETSQAPCLRPTRAGTQVQGDVRICPGHYRIADPSERGVIVAAASGTRIELTGVTLESGDSVPARYTGIGVASRGVDGVTIFGGAIRGYRFGLRIEGGRGHRVNGIDLSGSRAQRLGSTPERPDTADRLDVVHRATIDTYGGGMLLQGTIGATVTGVISRNGQNGIGLVDARDSYIADNDVSGNTGWGLQLWHSSHNAVVRNNATLTRRCEQRGGCDVAAVLVREGSDSNTFSDNDLSGSSVGVILAGEPPLSHASDRQPLSPERRLPGARLRVSGAPYLGHNVPREPGRQLRLWFPPGSRERDRPCEATRSSAPARRASRRSRAATTPYSRTFSSAAAPASKCGLRRRPRRRAGDTGSTTISSEAWGRGSCSRVSPAAGSEGT